MLKTVKTSGNKKTGPIAVTYRAGGHNVFGTCPKTCALNPRGEQGADLVDADYLQALRKAVPKNGQAWTYSHFPAELLPVPVSGETVINASCDTMADAVAAVRIGRPAVVAAPAGTVWPHTQEGVLFAQCPAELSKDFDCQRCGNGRPLCARGDREFVIVFVAHGSGSALVGIDTAGGCYGNGGPVRLAWEKTKTGGHIDDAAALAGFARSLPAGSLLRHHVVGDLGKAGHV
jgi:hypothetical protein